MKTLLLLLLCCHVTSTVKQSLKFFQTKTSGVRNFPEFVAVTTVDEVVIVFCDSNKTPEPKQDWLRTLFEEDPQHLQWYGKECIDAQNDLRTNFDDFKRRFNHLGGVHTLQRMSGCEWDDETGEVSGFNQYGYDGEDFIAFDLKTLTWIAPQREAVITKLKWDADKARLEYNKDFYLNKCPDLLKKYLNYGRSFLQRTVLPSVSLLQQTPSSPVRCFASGFYPERASLFWRKDGYDLHEDVDYGEILTNTDGTFQMSADLEVSSVSPEDWRRYECVFQLSGVKDDIVTKLNKTAIKTNWELPSVFVLQRTPSSPVRCFASGFYLERASLFWKKDGDKLHEEHEEILPNTDGTFQMSVDLDISSVSPEDWRRYECVFRIPGVKDDIVTKLDKTAIWTNWDEPSHMTVPIVASVAVLVLILIAAVGFIIYRCRKKASEL